MLCPFLVVRCFLCLCVCAFKRPRDAHGPDAARWFHRRDFRVTGGHRCARCRRGGRARRASCRRARVCASPARARARERSAGTGGSGRLAGRLGEVDPTRAAAAAAPLAPRALERPEAAARELVDGALAGEVAVHEHAERDRADRGHVLVDARRTGADPLARAQLGAELRAAGGRPEGEKARRSEGQKVSDACLEELAPQEFGAAELTLRIVSRFASSSGGCGPAPSVTTQSRSSESRKRWLSGSGPSGSAGSHVRSSAEAVATSSESTCATPKV